jgi:hypothetical protein
LTYEELLDTEVIDEIVEDDAEVVDPVLEVKLDEVTLLRDSVQLVLKLELDTVELAIEELEVEIPDEVELEIVDEAALEVDGMVGDTGVVELLPELDNDVMLLRDSVQLVLKLENVELVLCVDGLELELDTAEEDELE